MRQQKMVVRMAMDEAAEDGGEDGNGQAAEDGVLSIMLFDI